MSQDQVKFEHYGDHVGPERVARRLGDAPAMAIHDIERPSTGSGYEDLGKPVLPGSLSQMPTDQLVIRKAQDGGFMVIDSGAGIRGVPFLFAAGTIQEIAEYIENRFDPAS